MQLATESIADESSRPPDNADPAADPKTKADDPTKLFLVLEGGGAKGIAHVAAWKALDRLVAKPKEAVAPPPSDLGSERFVLTGVAGTSAGAVIAAFIAAGAKAEDLIDNNGEVPLCKTLNIRRFRDIFS